MTPLVSLEILRYCAEEVERQQDTPTAVLWMVRAWLEATKDYGLTKPMSIALVESWGQAVEPHENKHGFRHTAVRVGARLCPDWQDLPRLLAQWVEHLPRITPEEAYRAFEEIHPFRDGNGRTGKIILNYLKGTLDHPVMPPNWFNCANP